MHKKKDTLKDNYFGPLFLVNIQNNDIQKQYHSRMFPIPNQQRHKAGA